MARAPAHVDRAARRWCFQPAPTAASTAALLPAVPAEAVSARLPAVLAILLVALTAAPLAAFRGRVVDPEGRPMAHAEVSILGRPGTAVTDEEGHFEWSPDPAPPFEVLVVRRDRTYTSPVLVERLIPGEVVTIEAAPALSEGLVVSGSAPGIESTPAAGTTTVTAREIGVRQPSNLIQALENVAGVSQVSEGQAAVPAVRGLSAGRTLILIDGARVTAERRVGPSATFLDPALMESVEVSRGPGSVAYGSDAFGGVISVRTRGVEPGSGWGGRVNATLGAEGRPERRLSASLSKGTEQGGALLVAHVRQADDWESPRGEVFNSGHRDRGLFARAEHAFARGVLSAAWQSDLGRDIERPRNDSRSVRFSYPEEDSHRLTAGYRLAELGPLSRLSLTAFLGSYDQTTDQDRLATELQPRAVERALISARDFHLRGSGERLFERSRLELGLDLNGRFDLEALEERIAFERDGQRAASDTTVAIEDARRLDTAAYASLDHQLADRWTLAGGARLDRVTTDNRGGFFGDRSTAHDAASGFVALTGGSFRGFTVTVQAARGFRDPTLSDRYYRGPTGRGFITGNPDLDPETSLQLDLALRYSAKRFRLAAYAYRYELDDLIERFETDPDVFLFRNRGEARIRGYELEAQAELGWRLHLEAAAQVADGRAIDDDAPLDGISAPHLSVQLRRPIGDHAFVQARVATFADDDDPGPTEREVPAYTLVDLSGGHRFTEAFELRLLLRNLLDEEHLASESTRAVLAPGRSVALVASLAL